MADKEETVVLRMSGELKAQIKAAAESVGLSMTTFITDAALKKAQQLQRRAPAHSVHSGVPPYFRASCVEAENGGAAGYAIPGWHIAAGVGAQRPDDIGPDAWEREIDALKALIANRDDEGVWLWFQQHFPKYMALIPARRREQFLYGARRAYEDDVIGT
jgi:hypothetical protein